MKAKIIGAKALIAWGLDIMVLYLVESIPIFIAIISEFGVSFVSRSLGVNISAKIEEFAVYRNNCHAFLSAKSTSLVLVDEEELYQDVVWRLLFPKCQRMKEVHRL